MKSATRPPSRRCRPGFLTTAAAAAAVASWLLLLLSAASPASAFRAAVQPSTRAVLAHRHLLLRRDELPAKALPLPPLLHPRLAGPPPLRSPTRRRATIDVETPATPPLEDGGDEEEGSAAVLGRPVPYHELTVGVLRERFPGENRVSQSPDSVASLVKAGFNVVVEAGGACASFFPFLGRGLRGTSSFSRRA
jgi:hypothetical protein